MPEGGDKPPPPPPPREDRSEMLAALTFEGEGGRREAAGTAKFQAEKIVREAGQAAENPRNLLRESSSPDRRSRERRELVAQIIDATTDPKKAPKALKKFTLVAKPVITKWVKAVNASPDALEDDFGLWGMLTNLKMRCLADGQKDLWDAIVNDGDIHGAAKKLGTTLEP